MLKTQGYAALSAHSPLQPFSFERREPGDYDVLIKILYCGICHSDIHLARNEWKSSSYPIVPGHEIVGRVEKVGSKVTKYQEGDIAGIGCLVDSCRICSSCKEHEEQFCKQVSFTYNGVEQDLKTPTFGGYSSQIVVNEDYVLKVSTQLSLSNVAPLLCAGITTYSPLRRFNIGKGKKVAIVGLGGLGHMAVKFAVAMGAEVTVLSTSPEKENDAKKLGADKFVVTRDQKNTAAVMDYFDFILNTVSAQHDLSLYLNLLNRGGAMVLVGLPEHPLEIQPFSIIRNRRTLTGSLIGGIKETQEMLDYCATHNITCDVEIISVQKINEAFERTIKNDVRYRFVIDMSTL